MLKKKFVYVNNIKFTREQINRHTHSPLCRDCVFLQKGICIAGGVIKDVCVFLTPLEATFKYSNIKYRYIVRK